MEQQLVELSAYQVIEGSHVARVSGCVIVVIVLVNTAEFLDKRLHYGGVSTNNPAIE